MRKSKRQKLAKEKRDKRRDEEQVNIETLIDIGLTKLEEGDVKGALPVARELLDRLERMK